MKGQLNPVLLYLRRLGGGTDQGVTDGQLLQRFLEQQEEEAFHALMQRHGPMVLAVCQRVLNDVHEAEDAFQATFLVLARKARSIYNQATLAAYLYRVAFHIAVNARAQLARRRAREREVADMRQPSVAETADGELRQVLDEELKQLPEKYQAPLILCYLEGKTHEQAAQELGWPIGSMSRRMERAKQMLHHRLVRRGLVLSAAALAEAVARNAAQAAVPVALLDSTAKHAALFAVQATAAAAAGTGSTAAAALAEEALRTLPIFPLKAVAAALAAVVLISGSVGLYFSARKQPPHRQAAPAVLAEQQPETPTEEGPAWGPTVDGLRVRISCDRLAYRLGKDTVQVGFAIQNVTDLSRPVTLTREGQELTDVVLTGPDGQTYRLAGLDRPLSRRRSWDLPLRPSAVGRVTMQFDPEQFNGGLKPGIYSVRGLFRISPDGPRGPVGPLESNEVRFLLRPAAPAGVGAIPAGERSGPVSLSLLPIGEKKRWKPGDSPLPFSLVLNRHDEDMAGVRFLAGNSLIMEYQLEITGPDGRQTLANPTPRIEASFPLHFAYVGVLFYRLDRTPVGKNMGERFSWDPSGKWGQRGYRLERLISSPEGELAAGKYTVRAVYQLGAEARKQFGQHPAGLQLFSNPVEVWIGD